MTNHPQQLTNFPQAFLMIAVEGGSFEMGGESWNTSSQPVHPVELDGFWIGQYPVTQALWTAVMGEANNPSEFKGQNRPVETVSWDMIVQEFLPRLNEITRGSRPPGTAYRLPTEAEWEFAARGGMHWKKASYSSSGSNNLDEVGWYDENSHDETKPVGLKLPNKLGIYDMSGNVWEWCMDWYSSDYYQTCLDQGVTQNPKGPEKGLSRVIRGGSWFSFAGLCRSSFRNYSTPTYRHDRVGFRLVLFAVPV